MISKSRLFCLLFAALLVPCFPTTVATIWGQTIAARHMHDGNAFTTPTQTCFFPPDRLTPPAAIPSAVATTGPAPHRIVIRFVIVRRGNGSGGLDESLLDYFMRDLNYGFRDTPFVFVQDPQISYLDNDSYYANIPDFATATNLLNAYAQPGVMIHLLTPTIFGGPPVTGLNFPLNPRGNVLAYERIGQPHSIAFPPHEVGHVFWLYHPYETQLGTQCTSEADCASVGDLVCDTPASPAVHGGNTTATGFFFAQTPGPCAGDPNYAPLTDLYMEAGWPAGHILRDRFTPGQISRMINTLFSLSPDLISAQRPDILVDCDANSLDDLDEILAGTKTDLGQDMVPDICQPLPRPGDLLVSAMNADTLNRIRLFDRQSGALREIMWNGMSWVHQLRLGPDGFVYLTTLTVIQRLDLRTGRTHDNFLDGRFEGAGTFVDVLFDQQGDLLILDNATRNIRRYSGTDGSFLGQFATLVPTGMTSPKYMEFGPDLNIYVVGNGALGNTIQRIDAQSGQPMGSFIIPGDGGLITGQGLLFHTDGLLYVSNGAANNVLRYDATTGAFADVFVSSSTGGLSNPHSLRFGPDGNLYVASRNTNSVKRYSSLDGTYLGDFVLPGTDGLNQPTGLLFAPQKNGPTVPAASTWTLTVMALLMLTVTTLLQRRAPARRPLSFPPPNETLG